MTHPTPTQIRRYPCARCSKRNTAEQSIYSRHTGNRYCRDMGACDRRAKGLPPEKVVVARRPKSKGVRV